MIVIETTILNESARDAVTDIDDFLRHMDARMAGDFPDPRGTAARSYVVLRGIRERIKAEIARQEQRDRDERFERASAGIPTVRERSGLSR